MMANGPMTDEQLEALRQALDDAVLMHTGRSIGDLASGQVARDVVGTLHVWLQQQLEQQLAIPVYGPEPMAGEPIANHEPMSDRWLETFRREIALAFGVHRSDPVAEAVTRNAEKDLFYLIEEYQRLHAREAAAMEIVRAVAGVVWSSYCPWCNRHGTMREVEHYDDCPVLSARALLAQE